MLAPRGQADAPGRLIPNKEGGMNKLGISVGHAFLFFASVVGEGVRPGLDGRFMVSLRKIGAPMQENKMNDRVNERGC
jgi:hypothetical protein